VLRLYPSGRKMVIDHLFDDESQASTAQVPQPVGYRFPYAKHPRGQYHWKRATAPVRL
jgi:hypothetical protein